MPAPEWVRRIGLVRRATRAKGGNVAVQRQPCPPPLALQRAVGYVAGDDRSVLGVGEGLL